MSNSSSSDSIDQIFQAMDQVWNALTSPTANLNELPQHLHNSLAELYSKITQGGQLPQLPDFTIPQVIPAAPAPAVQPAVPDSRNLFFCSSRSSPYTKLLLATITTGAVAGTTYYFFPAQSRAFVTPLLKPLERFIPIPLLPPTNRPLRTILPNVNSPQEHRKEVALVLGAEGIVADLALDLERRGFVVIATVSNPADVEPLEKRGRGWIKVLVLDPNQSSSVPPFLRSLSTALSLRFPLHSSGDPFARPTHSLALTSIVNALSLTPANTSTQAIRPVEAIEPDAVRKSVGERVATVIATLAGTMPVLRNAAARPSAPEGVLLSLVPAKSTNISLPFHSLTSATDSAISSILDSLRRELTAARVPNVRVSVLEVGNFDTSSLAMTAALSPSTSSSPLGAELPVRLDSVYAPALARRNYISSASSASTASARSGGGRKSGSHPRKLNKKVWEVLVYGRGGRRGSVGGGAFTYRILSTFVPTYVIDSALSFHDSLVARFIAHRPNSHPHPLNSQVLGSNNEPTPPTPTSLRPGYGASSAPTTSSTGIDFVPLAKEREDDSSSEGGASSVEDFGVPGSSATISGSGIGGRSMGSSTLGGQGLGGSFVGVDRV
ncbi:hypothetical protein T439DRAFT_322516 [Meredithblackwellia eburnea MCA 4105]